MIIRPLQQSDVVPLTTIYNHYVRNSSATFEASELTVEDMRRRLFEPTSKFPCLVAEDNRVIAGYCAAHPWRPRFDHVAEVTMYLAPDYCAKGVGAKLLTEIIALCRNIDGLNGLIACINSENRHSKALLERFGFVIAGHYPKVGKKFGQWLDDTDYQLQF